MTELTADLSADSGEQRATEEAEIHGGFFARYGTFMLVSECDTPSPEEVHDRLEAALRADTRIKEIEEFDLRAEWLSRRVGYPLAKSGSEDELLSGEDHFHSVGLSDPVVFTVSIPIRNQPPFRGYSDIPSDTYYVAWDGTSVIVMWERDRTDTRPPRAGGHVVADVLRSVASRMGLSLYVQACSPGCQNLFAHRVLRINHASNAAESEVILDSDDRETTALDVLVVDPGGPRDVVMTLSRYIRYEAGLFSLFKNGARRILDLEGMSRSLVDELLELQYRRNARRKLGLLGRAKAAWMGRHDGRRMRELIASLWLAFTRLEALRSEWFPARDRFNDACGKYGTIALFSRDMKDDDRAVSRQELGYIRAAAEHSATRIDARTVALLTALSALAGFAGALIGLAVA